MSTLSMGKFRASLFAAVLAAASFSSASHAQDLGMRVKVKVPFAFEIESRHFTAGIYTIRMENPNMMFIQGNSGSGFALMWLEDDGQPAKTGKVAFRKYGNQYFLREIWVAGNGKHLHLQKSKAEGRLQIAGNKSAPTGVELALLETAR